ncbi:MAG: HlyD family efflux transporter periplasmic adaptor subunit [Balneolaceae bacterium]|nr:HlyD family efflux transporter periplasmic adaptor subunit [Balneolaceae bacterium]MCH8549815.1 HlyD family efflux transporter periplasmic adaptor subunit [Balneolaceae bacterium]
MDRKIEKKTYSAKKLGLITAGLLLAVFVLYTMAFRDSRAAMDVETERLFIEEIEESSFREFIDVNGTVQPEQTTYLDAIEGGVVQRVFLESGTMVEEGDTILVLSNSNLQLSVMQQEAGLYDQINNVRNSRLNLEQNHLNLQKELADSRAQVRIKRSRFLRDSTLHAKELISTQDFEETEQLYEYQKMRYQLNLESYRKDSVQVTDQLRQLEDSENRMWRSLDGVQQIMNNLAVVAPSSGQLSTIELNPGQSIQQGERLGQVDLLDGYKIRAGIDEFYLARIADGLQGSFQFAGNRYGVEVSRVFPVIEDGSFEVDMRFTDEVPDGIRRGQTVRTRLELSDASTALLLPRGAFYQHTSGNWVFLVNEEEGRAVRQPVRLGRGNNDYYEVLEGLSPGDRVITSSYDTFGEAEILNLQ